MNIEEFDLTADGMKDNSKEAMDRYYNREKDLFGIFERMLSRMVVSGAHDIIQRESNKGEFKVRITWYYKDLLILLENDKQFDVELKKLLEDFSDELDLKLFERFIAFCDEFQEKLEYNGFSIARKVVDSELFRSVTFTIDWSEVDE